MLNEVRHLLGLLKMRLTRNLHEISDDAVQVNSIR